MSLPHILSFLTVVIALIPFSILDLRYRRVSNRYTMASIVVGCMLITLTGQIFIELWIHLFAIVLMLWFVLVLYRIGSLGGADVKILLFVSITSPGLVFVVWDDFIIEGLVGTGMMVVLILILASTYSRTKRSTQHDRTPLVPFMLIAYLCIQMLSLLL
ncbi:MAG: prepilin peptidase [Candidatus Thorarchaeota archaeon]|nr:prepilin peptidase [Candidatus Thorarchaeota archaeon]